jgi:hypothetical protein
MNPRSLFAATTALVAVGASFSALTAAAATTPFVKQIPDVVVGSATAPEAGHITVRGIDVEIGASTEAGVRRAEGRKPTSFLPLMGRSGPIGKVMTYTFSVGKGKCEHTYGFPLHGGSLVDFSSTCPNTKSFAGAKVGMIVRRAEQVTGAVFGSPGKVGDYLCLFDNPGMVYRGPGAYIVVWAEASSAAEGDSARVESIAAYGDNALVFTAGICEPA